MAVVGFLRNYTWLCAVCCFIVAIILGSQGLREKRNWVTTEARVVNSSDSCQMLPQIDPNERRSVWAGTVPCADVEGRKAAHSDYKYDVTPMRTFTIEYVSPERRVLTTETDGRALLIPQTAGLDYRTTIDYAIAAPAVVRLHEGLRGLQMAILFNVFGLCLLGFAWLSHITHGGQTTGAPTGDWLSNIDLPPDAVAGQKTATNARKYTSAKPQPRPTRREPALKQSAAKAGGFGRKV